MRALLLLTSLAMLPAADDTMPPPMAVPDIVVMPRAQLVQLLDDNLRLRHEVIDSRGAAAANEAAVRTCIAARSS